MESWTKLATEHGIAWLISVLVILLAVQTVRGFSKLIAGYFSENGVATRWFLADADSRRVMAQAMQAMPRAIDDLRNATLEHHDRMQESVDTLVAIQRENAAHVCRFHEQAAELDGLFSSHYTNKALLEAVDAARVLIGSNEPANALGALERAERLLIRGLGARDQG